MSSNPVIQRGPCCFCWCTSAACDIPPSVVWSITKNKWMTHHHLFEPLLAWCLQPPKKGHSLQTLGKSWKKTLFTKNTCSYYEEMSHTPSSFHPFQTYDRCYLQIPTFCGKKNLWIHTQVVWYRSGWCSSPAKKEDDMMQDWSVVNRSTTHQSRPWNHLRSLACWKFHWKKVQKMYLYQLLVIFHDDSWQTMINS